MERTVSATDDGVLRLAMWSGPRNLSTAFMRSWENRGDTIVIDEPFYAHYLKVTGLDHPGRDEIIAHHDADWRRVVDSLRAQQMMNAMLKKITETSAKVMILDIQGVAAVDTAVANHLIKITQATKLMGCRCIISGISAAVAETLVQLGINLGDVTTNSTLMDALADAFQMLNLEVKKIKV